MRSVPLPGWWFALLLAVATLCTPAQGGQSKAERVAGRVVSARGGQPIQHAQLSLQITKTGAVAAETFSGDDGSFRFDPVPAGRYRITGRARGFLEAAYLQHGSLSSAVVTGAGLATGSLMLQLTPGALIGGHVLSEAGEPVARATVSLYRADRDAATEHMRLLRSVPTDDEGRYEFRDLAEGQYFLVVTGTPWYAVHPGTEPEGDGVAYRASVAPGLDVAYPTMYYPGAFQSDQARPLTVRGGEEVTADLGMVPVPAVSLTLQRPPNAGPNQGFPTLTHSVFGVQEIVPLQGTFLNGVQQFNGLAPGEYSLEPFRGGRAAAPSQAVDLRNGPVVMALPAAGPDLATVAVHVQGRAGATLPGGLQLNLRDLRQERRFASSQVDAKGAAQFPDVPVGEYRPVLFHEGRQIALAAITVNGTPVPDRQIRVTGGGRLEVTVTAAGDPVTLTGVVERNGKASVGVLVVLVPAGADTSEDLFRRDQSDLDGGFTFAGVAPGNYIVVAVEGGWDLPWTDLRTMGKYLLRGVPVAVKDGAGSGNDVRLSEPVTPQPQ